MIDKITIATTHHEAMTDFYQAVLGLRLQRRALGDDAVWIGEIRGVEFFLVPRHLANVYARANNVQVRFVVEDMALALEAATLHGGGLIGEPAQFASSRVAAVRDPDGNFVELIQRGITVETTG